MNSVAQKLLEGKISALYNSVFLPMYHAVSTVFVGSGMIRQTGRTYRLETEKEKYIIDQEDSKSDTDCV